MKRNTNELAQSEMTTTRSSRMNSFFATINGPVFDRKCLHCGKLNRFEKGCRSNHVGSYTSTQRGFGGQQSVRRHLLMKFHLSSLPNKTKMTCLLLIRLLNPQSQGQVEKFTTQ